MTHRIDPDPRYIAAGIARLELAANGADRPVNCRNTIEPNYEREVIAAAARRALATIEAADAARARRRVVAWAIASAVLGTVAIVAIVVGAITAAGMS